MKRIALLIMLITAYISIDAAANSQSSAHQNGSNATELSSAIGSTSDSVSFNKPGRALTPAEYERFTEAANKIDQNEAQFISVNNLINLVTDFSLRDPIATEQLKYIRRKLLHPIHTQRLELIRTKLDQKLDIDSTHQEYVPIIMSDQQLAQFSDVDVASMIDSFEEYLGLNPVETNLSEQRLADLIDAADEGKLADMVDPLEFLELLHSLRVNSGITKEQRKLLDTMFLAAENYNIINNPTYNLFAYDQRQNQLLQRAQKVLNAYYATSGRQRRTALATKAAKKSFAQRWFARRK